jgi:hypothetical protein
MVVGYTGDICVDDLVLASDNNVLGGHCTGVLPGGGNTNVLPGGSSMEVLAGGGNVGVGDTLDLGNLGGAGGCDVDTLTSGFGMSDGQTAGRRITLTYPKKLRQHWQRWARLRRPQRRWACLRPLGVSGSNNGALGFGGAIRRDILNANNGWCSGAGAGLGNGVDGLDNICVHRVHDPRFAGLLPAPTRLHVKDEDGRNNHFDSPG